MTLHITKTLHTRLKVLAAQTGKEIQQLAEKILQEGLDKREGKK